MPGTITADNLVDRSFRSKTGLVLPYRLYVPLDYLQSKRYPLVLVLHGSGERGHDNRKQLQNGVLAFCEPKLQRKQAAFVVYPQCPEGARWVESDWNAGSYDLTQVPLSAPLSAALDLMSTLEQEFTIDRGRLLVTGLSMGGYGTWDVILRYPDRFAGGMPLCGGGDPRQAAAARKVPVWAFHGAKDDTVPVAGARKMVQALRKAGGHVRYTEYPTVGHAVWDKAYADQNALRWLIGQRRPASAPGAPASVTPATAKGG
jgi:predicted peptidase